MKLKSFIVSVLVVVMAISQTTFAAFAADQGIKAAVTEVDGIRTSTTRDDNKEYTVIYDTINETIQYSERTLDTNSIVESGVVEIEPFIDELVSVGSTRATTITQSTDSLFKYICSTGRQNDWYLQRPNTESGGSKAYYFRTYENSSNDLELEDFQDAVDDLADKESTFDNLVKSSIFSAVITGFAVGFAIGSGGILSEAAIAAVLGTVALSSSAYAAAEAVANQCNDCMFAIEDVFYATDNFHY